MSLSRPQSIRQHALAAAILWLALVAAWFAYAPGIGGSFLLDDQPNLTGLAQVNDQTDAWHFILSGRAGPTGRPLALASFAAQAYAWPNEPAIFLRTNILIHLLNGALVCWALYLLGLARSEAERPAALVAAGAAALWMLMPILASSSLLIIQRMTTLSASFVLLGAIGYLYARRQATRRPVLALCGMTLALGLGVGLSMLCKENGILLLVFVLVIEVTLLRRPSGTPTAWWRSWFSLALMLPVVLIVAYLATRLPYSEDIIIRRDFNGFERLITQAGILWKYLYLSFVPNLPGLGPFHDDYPPQKNLLDATVLLAILAWGAMVAFAIMLRRRAPLFTFAIAWYLGGHLIESTTIPLELYFEHRNYLPLVGPAYAVVAAISRASLQWRRLLTICMAAYLAVLGGVLYSTVTLWGTPAIAAEMWYIYKPESIRAAENVSKQMEQDGNLPVSRKVLTEVRQANPDAHYLDLQILLFSCFIEPDKDHSHTASELKESLRTARFSHSVTGLMQNFYRVVRQDKCRGVGKDDVYQLGQSVLANPKYSRPDTTQIIHSVLARIAIDQEDLDLAMEHIEAALHIEPDPNMLVFFISMLKNSGLDEMAAEVISLARTKAPSDPRRAAIWKREIERINREKLERNPPSRP